jgi:integrase
LATIERREDAKGNVRYRARVRIRGAKSRSRTFKRLTDARDWARNAEESLGHGVFVPTGADRRRTLADVIDKFEKEQLPNRAKNADSKKMSAQLKWWRDNAGFLTLDKLTPGEISGFRSQLLARKTGRAAPTAAPEEREVSITPATANRYLAALSAVCKWAWKELGWLPSNPVLSVSKGAERAGIVRYLDDDERSALLKACRASSDPNIYCAVMLALATGARAGNLRALTWDDVDRKVWRLRFQQTKNQQPRYVPVVGSAQAVLQAQFDKDPTKKGWVFKGYRDDAPADIDRPWRDVRAAAGLTGAKHCRFHDLRHTTASYLTMNGATLAEVAEALGHQTLVMAKRYSHQSGEHVRGTLERMASRFLSELPAVEEPHRTAPETRRRKRAAVAFPQISGHFR